MTSKVGLMSAGAEVKLYTQHHCCVFYDNPFSLVDAVPFSFDDHRTLGKRLD